MNLHPSNILRPGLARGDGYGAKQATNGAVRLLQEYLCLCGQSLALDGEFGPATEAALDAVADVLTVNQWAVDRLTFLVFGSALWVPGNLVTIARAHLDAHAREVGGSNRGPWVRQYADGREGDPWCGYAARAWARQAAHPWAERISPSCDTIGRNAREDGRLQPAGELPAVGDLYLRRNRYNADDFEHVGVVTSVGLGWFATISGNSNAAGGREGIEVCAGKAGISDRYAFVRMA